jgi:hypothetical protein
MPSRYFSGIAFTVSSPGLPAEYPAVAQAEKNTAKARAVVNLLICFFSNFIPPETILQFH